jgi:hypothetical protein
MLAELVQEMVLHIQTPAGLDLRRFGTVKQQMNTKARVCQWHHGE